MQKGSAFMRFTAAGPVAIDFGSDLFGGSLHLSETKPWDRTPRWRAAVEGPPCDYDVALHLDFEDEAGLEAYNKDDVHHEIAVYNAAVCQGELTARIDWWYEGDAADDAGPRPAHGDVHVEGRRWTRPRRSGRSRRSSGSGTRPASNGSRSGPNVGDAEDRLRLDPRPPAPGRGRGRGARRRATAYREAMRALAGATKYEWTARHDPPDARPLRRSTA